MRVVSLLWSGGCEGGVGAEVVDVKGGGVSSEEEGLWSKCVNQSGGIRYGAIFLASLAN